MAACEQCGRNQVPVVHEVLSLSVWLAANKGKREVNSESFRYLLSLRPETQALNTLVGKGSAAVTFLSGPEGGLSTAEEEAALTKGFQPVSLGNRILRAETAGLAALTLFTV